MQKLLEALDERVLVCDGAMGTMLYARGVFINKSFDALNITQPDLVAEVHQEYLRAGADIVETNTFGANRIKLGSFGLADKLEAINEQAARIARHAVSAAGGAARSEFLLTPGRGARYSHARLAGSGSRCWRCAASRTPATCCSDTSRRPAPGPGWRCSAGFIPRPRRRSY